MMRLKILCTLGLAIAAVSPSFAEDGGTNEYVYRPDGTYAQTNGSELGTVGGSAVLQGTIGFAEDGGTLYGLKGSYAYNVSSYFNTQLDVGYQATEVSGTELSSISGAAHIFTRDPQDYAAGGFLHFGGDSVGNASSNSVFAGAEYAKFYDRITLMAQAGLGTNVSSNADLIAAKLSARLYVNENARIDVDVSATSAELPTSELTTLEFGLTGNYRLDSLPISLFGSYRYETATLDSGAGSVDTDGSLFFLGARYHYGTTSLREEERTGTLWSPIVGYFE